MGQRNMLCMHQMLDLELDQAITHRLAPEPCILNLADFQNPSIPPVFSASGSATNLDVRHDNNIFYGNQYNTLQHRHPVSNLDVGGSATPNFSFNQYMMPTSSRIGPMPPNHGSSDHLASSHNHGMMGVSVDEYGRNNHLIDGGRGSSKRKNAEGAPGGYIYVDGPAGSSSSSSLCGPLNSGLQLWEESFEPSMGLMEAATPFNPSEYRGNGNPPISESGPHRSVRSRSNGANLQLDSVFAHHCNQIVQSNHMGQTFQHAGGAWVERFGSGNADAASSNWHYVPPRPYLPGRSINGGPIEVTNMNRQGFQDPTSSRNPGILLHPSSIPPHQVYHLPPSHGVRGNNYSYNAIVPLPSYRHPTNNFNQGMLNPSRDAVESSMSRYPRTLPSGTDRIHRPQRRAAQSTQEDMTGHMRLLSPEELLALQERIGDVNTGLSQESIAKCLKTRLYSSCSTSSPLDQPEAMDQENETCTICQVEYEDNEKIGTLGCGHDYHADCIRQWLMVKNLCPMCKTSALSEDKKEG